eukprot:CCRYP_003701-RB/>CCRYP_003701-RB protein AED:0.02 eAED:0.02 QI:146/1/1/1/1/0.66/3/664/413
MSHIMWMLPWLSIVLLKSSSAFLYHYPNIISSTKIFPCIRTRHQTQKSYRLSFRCHYCCRHRLYLQLPHSLRNQLRQRSHHKHLSMSSSRASDGEKMNSNNLTGDEVEPVTKNDVSDDDDSYFSDEFDGHCTDKSSNDCIHVAVDQNPATSTTEDGTPIVSLPKGISKGYHIISHATIPASGFSVDQLLDKLKEDEIQRLHVSPSNVTVPVAMILMFPREFGTLTKARKECRRKKVIILRHLAHQDGSLKDTGANVIFDAERMKIGRVGDRVYPGDTIAIQTRTGNDGYTESMKHNKEPPFHLPVIYQDDHLAVVNKPEGVVVFGHKNGGYGRHTVKSALPYVLKPPTLGTLSVMWNPVPVHRLDRATSGLLVVAKTKAALVHLSHQFKERKVKKTCERYNYSFMANTVGHMI